MRATGSSVYFNMFFFITKVSVITPLQNFFLRLWMFHNLKHLKVFVRVMWEKRNGTMLSWCSFENFCRKASHDTGYVTVLFAGVAWVCLVFQSHEYHTLLWTSKWVFGFLFFFSFLPLGWMVMVNITPLMLPSYFACSFLCYLIMMLSLRSKFEFALHFNTVLFGYYWMNFTAMLSKVWD